MVMPREVPGAKQASNKQSQSLLRHAAWFDGSWSQPHCSAQGSVETSS